MNEPVAASLISPGARDPIVDAAAVEVLISFAPIVMSVAQVEALQRGQIIDIGCRVAQAQLSVQASGREIGCGYLIALLEDSAGLMLSKVQGRP